MCPWACPPRQVHSTGTVYELLEAVVTHLAHSQLPTVPVYFVSPTAKESLSYANICAQWLNKTRAGKVMLPEWPFQHAEHVANGIIQVHKPCVHPQQQRLRH